MPLKYCYAANFCDAYIVFLIFLDVFSDVHHCIFCSIYFVYSCVPVLLLFRLVQPESLTVLEIVLMHLDKIWKVIFDDG